MNVLVADASRHGATRGIAERLAEVIERAGLDVVRVPLPAATAPPGFDAAVIGSAVYMGHWMKEATAFVEAHRHHLAARPLWLFSSGPVGPRVLPEPREIATLRQLGSVREHRVFAGALDRSRLTGPERFIATAVRAREGDFRDWAAIEQWALSIVSALAGGDAQPRVGGAVEVPEAVA